jgi:hypothetical protein
MYGDLKNLTVRSFTDSLSQLIINGTTSITRPPSSLTEGRRYVTDGVRLAQRPRRGASRRLR